MQNGRVASPEKVPIPVRYSNNENSYGKIFDRPESVSDML